MPNRDRAGGDEERFRALYERHYAAVSEHVARRVGNPDDADEIVVAVFLRAWRRLDRLSGEPDDRQWLLRAAWSLIDNYQKGGRRYRRLLRRISLFTDVPITDGFDRQEAHDPLVRRAFDSLKPDHQELLRLYVWEELPPSDIAEVLGCSVNTFYVRLHRARAAYRSAYEHALADGPATDGGPKPSDEGCSV
jgi:RNA polymerase sigma factor (sigma-70 family)